MSVKTILAILVSLAVVLGVPAVPAPAWGGKPPAKVKALDLLKNMDRALGYMVLTIKKNPKDKSLHGGNTAALTKAIKHANKEVEELQKAYAKKDKKFARHVSKVSSAVTQVETAFRLSGIKNKKMAEGVSTLTNAWGEFRKNFGSNHPPASTKPAAPLSKKQEKEMADLKARSAQLSDKLTALEKQMASKDKKQAKEVAAMIAQAKQVNAAQATADGLLAAMLLMDTLDGWYTGYHDHIIIEHPAYKTYFTPFDAFWTAYLVAEVLWYDDVFLVYDYTWADLAVDIFLDVALDISLAELDALDAALDDLDDLMDALEDAAEEAAEAEAADADDEEHEAGGGEDDSAGGDD